MDIFFVISGYVVVGSLLHKPERDALTYYAQFYARRLKRLMPTLLVVVWCAGLVIATAVRRATERKSYFLVLALPCPSR